MMQSSVGYYQCIVTVQLCSTSKKTMVVDRLSKVCDYTDVNNVIALLILQHLAHHYRIKNSCQSITHNCWICMSLKPLTTGPYAYDPDKCSGFDRLSSEVQWQRDSAVKSSSGRELVKLQS